MVKLNNFGSQPSQPTGFNQNSQFSSQTNQNQTQFTEQPAQNQSTLNNQSAPPKGLFQIPEKFLQLIP